MPDGEGPVRAAASTNERDGGEYLGAALDPTLRPYVIAATILAGAMTVLSLVVVVSKRHSPREMPRWIAFLVLALSGLWALS